MITKESPEGQVLLVLWRTIIGSAPPGIVGRYSPLVRPEIGKPG